jgi:flagellar motor switch protein FliG
MAALQKSDIADYMDERRLKRETERVVKKVLRVMESYEAIGKKEFETILDKVIDQVHRNTGLSRHAIGQKTQTVVQALPQEYGQLSEAARSWEALITYLYLKYLRELGVLEEQ